MKEAKLWECALKQTPDPTDPTKLATQWKKEAKVKRIFLDSKKDHFFPHISYKKKINKMSDSVVELVQNSCAS